MNTETLDETCLMPENKGMISLTRRGIRFKLKKQSYPDLLQYLLIIDIDNLIWVYENLEIHDRNSSQSTIDTSDFPDNELGISLKERLKDKDYFLIFGEFTAFLSVEEISEVVSYEDFLLSNAIIKLLVVDVYYVDIYIKDKRLIEEFFAHIKTMNNVKELEFIEEPDPRTALKIF